MLLNGFSTIGGAGGVKPAGGGNKSEALNLLIKPDYRKDGFFCNSIR